MEGNRRVAIAIYHQPDQFRTSTHEKKTGVDVMLARGQDFPIRVTFVQETKDAFDCGRGTC